MYRKGDRVRLTYTLPSDRKYGMVEGQTYFVQEVLRKNLTPYIIGETPEIPTATPMGWVYVMADQVELVSSVAKAQILSDSVIRDSKGKYWLWVKEKDGWLYCLGSEVEVEDDQNGYRNIPSLKAAWNTLVQDGFIEVE